MVYTNGLRSPRDESNFSSFTSPSRTIGGQMSSNMPSSTAERASLHRRFTTNAVPTLPTLSSLSPLSPIGQQRRQAAEPQSDLTSSTLHSLQLLQKKKEEYAYLREQRERFKTEMELLDLRAQSSEHEMQRLESEVQRINLPGHQSEPTTPPEYRENGFPSAIARPNRLSLASLSALTSPPKSNTFIPSHRNTLSASHHGVAPFAPQSSQTPSDSVPTSRRNSDEENDKLAEADIAKAARRSAVRNSMPVTNFDYRGMSQLPDVGSVLGINNINSLLSEDDDYPLPSHRHTGSMDTNSILRAETTKEEFPILVRRPGEMLPHHTTSSMDVSGAVTSGADGIPSWPTFARHRQGQQSLPMNTLRSDEQENAQNRSRTSSVYDTPTRSGASNNRRSIDVMFSSPLGQPGRTSAHASPPSGNHSNGMPNLRSSLSTNDIPTVNSMNGNSAAGANLTHAAQHLHNHNANMGRIPSAVNRHSRDLSSSELRTADSFQAFPTTTAPPAFNLAATTMATTTTATVKIEPGTGPNAAGNLPYPYYGQSGNNFGMQGAQQYSAAPQYSQYSPYYWQQQQQQFGMNKVRDSQPMVVASRRNQGDGDGYHRFANTQLETLEGQIFELSKDQHGCRYLQKKIEEGNKANLAFIFPEIKDHVVELMKDSFGNYLCQKILEFASEEQRTVLINNAAPSMVDIATNQHGTRALQKMIEFITTREQVQTIVSALRDDVVPLIQDLNGNHVIQKCLTHLRPDDAQFVYDAAGLHALTVGTHRHGCCVLQRCIDHATGPQKAKLIHDITVNSFTLVQDPFGNYVIQYILDLNYMEYTKPLCYCFQGSIVELSKQKFSSNVIEKCLRVADSESQAMMVEELVLMDSQEMERMLRDPYANYVMQTAVEYSHPELQGRLWDVIIPIMPNLRNTPCGRRLMTKLQNRNTDRSGRTSGTMTPKDGMGNALALPFHPGGYNAQYNAIAGAQPYVPPHAASNDLRNPPPAHVRNPAPPQSQYYPYAAAPQGNTQNYY